MRENDQSACFPLLFEFWIGCFTVHLLPGVILLMVWGTVSSPIAVPYVPPSTKAFSWRQHTLWESVLAFFSSIFRKFTKVLTWFCSLKPAVCLIIHGSHFCCRYKLFLGLRTLRADGHHREQIPVSDGLVAGSSQASHLARALHHRALHDHQHRCP